MPWCTSRWNQEPHFRSHHSNPAQNPYPCSISLLSLMILTLLKIRIPALLLPTIPIPALLLRQIRLSKSISFEFRLRQRSSLPGYKQRAAIAGRRCFK